MVKLSCIENEIDLTFSLGLKINITIYTDINEVEV